MSERFEAEAILRAAASGAIPAEGNFLIRGPDGWFFGTGAEGAGGGPGAASFADLIGDILDFQVPASAVTQHEQLLSLLFTQLTDEIADGQVPESAVTQHEAALTILFSQIVGEIPIDKVPAAAILQWCDEILKCEPFNVMLSRSMGDIDDDRIPASAVLQWSDALLEVEPFNFMLAQATSPRPGPADLIRLCGLLLECDPFTFMLKRATSRRPHSVNDRCLTNGALV